MKGVFIKNAVLTIDGCDKCLLLKNGFCPFDNGVPKRCKEVDVCVEAHTKPDWCPLVEVDIEL